MDRLGRARTHARWLSLTLILAGSVSAPAILMTPTAATAATPSLDSTSVQASTGNPVGDVLGYVETTLLTELGNVGCPLNISKAFCP